MLIDGWTTDQWSGDLPSWSITSTWAPPSMRACTTSVCPISHALNSGVCIRRSWASISDPCSSSNRTVLAWPDRAAACNPVENEHNGAAEINVLTYFANQFWQCILQSAAKWVHIKYSLHRKISKTNFSDKFCSKDKKWTEKPFKAQQRFNIRFKTISPVPPFLSICLRSGLCLTQVAIASSAPLLAAHIRAVLPSKSGSSVILARVRNTYHTNNTTYIYIQY